MEIIYEKAVFAPKGGKPGYIVNGKWYPVDPKDLESEGLKKELERYGRMRGKEQIEKDISSLKPKPPAPATTTPPAPAPAAPATTTPPAPAPATPAATQRPAAKPLETRMSAVTGKREFVGTTAGGTKFERRAATGAELRAAQAAREAAKTAGNTKGAEEAAVKAGVEAPKPKATSTPATSTKTDRPQRARTGFGEEYDAYDLVLEYILSEGHADTLSEAHYVMMQMSSDYIQSIVEQLDPDSPGNTHSLADLYKAQEKYFKDNPHLDPKTGKPRKGGSGASSQAKGV